MKKFTPYIIFFLILISIFFIINYKNKEYDIALEKDVNNYIKKIYKIERNFIENIPIFSDFTSAKKESSLRRYLFKDHIKIAEKHGVVISSDADIPRLFKKKKLNKLETGIDKLYYFYNVRKRYRYLTPGTEKGLIEITERFQKNLNKRKSLPKVKLAISSVIRPISYQKKLRGRNFNASIISTHSYATSFDIFVDDYFISLPEAETSLPASKKICESIKKKFAFVLGDSLRRQFHAILMETLIELQNEGKIYVILERRQRCYHITPLSKN